MSTSVARRRTVTPNRPLANGIPDAGRPLLAKVMGRILARCDTKFAVWCRENRLNVWKVRSGLLGVSKAPEAVAGARAAMVAAGLEDVE